MKILVSAVRMPFALAIIRGLGETGHVIVATDSIPYAPGLHSHWVTEHVVTVAPRDDPARYVGEIRRIYTQHGIERHVPTFEESFYLAAHRDELEEDVPLFLARWEALRTLHNKATFVELCERLAIRAPRTTLARSRDELAAAIERLPHYCARPAFSRGALTLLTNTGPKAGEISLDDTDPTEQNPFLVQEFIGGTDLCSYSICHDGRVAAHLTYEIPIKLDHAEGVQFETADVPETLEAAQRIAADTGYTGNLSLDWKRDDEGLCAIECNPRVTNGSILMNHLVLGRAILEGPANGPVVTESGRKTQVDLGVAAEVVTRQLSIGRGLHELLRVPDLYAEHGDMLPELYQYLQFVHNYKIAGREKITIMDAMQRTTCWDGEPIR